jgi:hypothetical protein
MDIIYIQGFIDKYRALNLPNGNLSKEGRKVDKKVDYLYGRDLLLSSAQIRVMAILLQNVNLSTFTNEELQAVGSLNLFNLLNDSKEILDVNLSFCDHIFYEDSNLLHITERELQDHLQLSLEKIKQQFCIQKTSIDNFIVRSI